MRHCRFFGSDSIGGLDDEFGEASSAALSVEVSLLAFPGVVEGRPVRTMEPVFFFKS
jgi:hypothetical protein